MLLSFEFLLQVVQQAEPLAFEFPYPPLVDLVQRHRVDEMQLLPATPDRAHQISRLEDPDVLGGRLPRHVQVLAELAQRLPVPLAQQVEEPSTRRVTQRLENLVSVHLLRSCEGMICRYL